MPIVQCENNANCREKYEELDNCRGYIFTKNMDFGVTMPIVQDFFMAMPIVELIYSNCRGEIMENWKLVERKNWKLDNCREKNDEIGQL